MLKSKMLLIMLMCIDGAPISTSSSVKIVTIAIIISTIMAILKVKIKK